MLAKSVIFAAIGLIHVAAPTRLFAQGGGKTELRPVRITTPPKLDGILDDEAWSGDPLQLEGWIVVQPDARRAGGREDAGVDRLRRGGAVFRVPLPRYAARENSHDHQPARQRVLRRLGRRQPRLEPRRTTRLSPVRESERHPDGCAAERFGRRKLRARFSVAKRGSCRRGRLVRRDSYAAREYPLSQRLGRAHGRVVLEAPQPLRRFNIMAGNG